MDPYKEQSTHHTSHFTGLIDREDVARMASNVYYTDDEAHEGPLPERNLPPLLVQLIDHLRSEHLLPDPESKDFLWHSEIRAVQQWIQEADYSSDIGLDGLQQEAHSRGFYLTTYYKPVEGEGFNVPPCANCRAVLDWCGVQHMGSRSANASTEAIG